MQPYDVLDYTAALDVDGLRGRQLGVPHKFLSIFSRLLLLRSKSLKTMEELGATIIDLADFLDFDDFVVSHESIVLSTDFKVCTFCCFCV